MVYIDGDSLQVVLRSIPSKNPNYIDLITIDLLISPVNVICIKMPILWQFTRLMKIMITPDNNFVFENDYKCYERMSFVVSNMLKEK